jgi:hypothetical protein
MKPIHQICAAVIMTLAFAFSTYADDGHIPCGIAAPTPAATITGDIDSGLTDIAVSLIQSVLSLS